MKRAKQVFAAAAVLVFVGSLAIVNAGANSIAGELSQVDAEAMTLVVVAADGAEHQFSYTADTEVTGAQEGSAGLASKAGMQVIVHWSDTAEEDQPRVATKIEVQG